MTEIYDYSVCCMQELEFHIVRNAAEKLKTDRRQMVDHIMGMPERTKIQLLAPVVRGRKGTHAKLFEQARKSGYVRVLVDGNLYELNEEIKLDKNIKHNIEIIVDRLIVKTGIEKRLTDSIETVLNLAEGRLV